MTQKVRFVSTGGKFEEAQEILAPYDIEVVPVRLRLTELQVEDVEALLMDKIIQAFKVTGRPVFVEHTGLYLDALFGLPGGLTRLVWERLQEERFCKLFGGYTVTAKTVVAYCDTRIIHPLIRGEAKGCIAKAPAGDDGFAWDRVFVPEEVSGPVSPVQPDEPAERNGGKTYAELGEMKNEISMRRKALDKLGDFLRGLQ